MAVTYGLSTAISLLYIHIILINNSSHGIVHMMYTKRVPLNAKSRTKIHEFGKIGRKINIIPCPIKK